MSLMSATATWMREHSKAVGGALVGLATVAATALMFVDEISKRSATTSDRPAITVTSPKGEVVPRCAKFSGFAPVLAGYDLWASFESPFKNFAFAKADHRPDGVWTRESTIGGRDDAGAAYIVRVFYLAKEDSEFLSGLRGLGRDGREGYWFASRLPAKTHYGIILNVTRDAQTGVSPCGGP